MATLDAPEGSSAPDAAPDAAPRPRAPGVVTVALVVVLGGTALLAIQNCGAESPAAQPPPKGGQTTGAPSTAPHEPQPPPLPPPPT